MSRMAGSKVGAPSSDTEFGPPERMIAVGFHARIHSSYRVGGWISENTRASRTRRAINCVNCEPQSRIRIRDVAPSATEVSATAVPDADLSFAAVNSSTPRRRA